MSDYSRRRRHGGGGGGRRRHRHHGGGRRRHHHHRSEKKETKGILGFFKRLFGLEKKSSGSQSNRSKGGRREGRSSMFQDGDAPRHHQREEMPIEVHSPKLYVGNLSYDTSESDLFDLFAQAGSVHNVEIVRDRQSNSKGFGFVEMQALETAKQAVEQFNGTEFMGRQIVVNGAKS